jgi:carbon-monoxide dehydrogenase medium subunit
VAGASVEFKAGEYFTGLFTTALRPNDVLTRVTVPVQVAGQGAAYLKHKHPASGYAVVGVAAIIGVQDGRPRSC